MDRYYELTVTRVVPVIEEIHIDVYAENEDEAKDLAYEISTNFPENMDLVVDRCLISDRSYMYEGVEIKDVSITQKKENTAG